MSSKCLKIYMISGFCLGLFGRLSADELSVKRLTPPLEAPVITSYMLPNGLKVLLNPDSAATEVTVNVVYKTGAKHESPGEYGMAHLLEHLAFHGTKNYRDIPQELERRGGRFNANTNADRTTYYETLPASRDNLEFALGMEAERMSQADLSEIAIQKELVAVKKEWEQSSRSGFQPLLKEMLQLAYPHHAYGRDTFGIEAGLLQRRAEELRAFYARRYRPQLAILSVGGHFAVEDVQVMIKKYFAALPASPEPVEERKLELRPQYSERLVIIPKPGGPSYVGVLYRAMPGADASYVAAQALVHCLGNHPESILKKKLVRSGLARDVFGFVQQSVDEGFIAFMAKPGQGRDPMQLVQRLARLVESSAASCQSKELQDFLQENAQSWAEFRKDSRAVTMQLGEYEVLGDWRLMMNEPMQSQGLRLEDVQNASRWLTRNNRTAGVLDHRSTHSLAGRRTLP